MFRDEMFKETDVFDSWIGPFPMVPGVNPIQLDVQNPNLRSKSLENLRKTKCFRDEMFKEPDVFNDY